MKILLLLVAIRCFGLSLEEKVGQVLMVHFHGVTANDEARALIEDAKVGGIIYYNWSNGLHSREQVAELSAGLQNLAGSIPLLIAADQEGGIVARLQNGFTVFPGNRALGETGNPNLAKEAAFAMGQELLSVGINMNLAPVVDVNCNPRNPVIGIRSFGDQAETVVSFAEQSLEGYKESGVIATLKHFPGHGDVAIDSHEDLPVVRKSIKDLEAVELLPFAKLASSADAIMTAHILVPALDEVHCSTLSEKTLRYLRESIGFEGVIVSDSLVMDGVLKKCHSVDEAAIQAFNAGCDLLILGGKLLNGEHAGYELTVEDILRIRKSMMAAVEEGRISEEKLDKAVERILKLKKQVLHSEIVLDWDQHKAIAEQIASSALKVIENRPVSHLNEKKVLVVAPKIVQNQLQSTTLLEIGKEVETFFFNGLSPTEDEIDAILQKADVAEIFVLSSYNAWKNPSAITLTQKLLAKDQPLILLCLRDPLDASLFEEADLIFQTFSPTVPAIQAICDELVNFFGD